MTGWRKRQVLALALEALETAEIDGNCEYGATEIIRKALTQPEFWAGVDFDIKTTPPQRTWVGLTDDELEQLSNKWRIIYGGHVGDFAHEIEAKLKEKNFD
jgi:hypothetical protein